MNHRSILCLLCVAFLAGCSTTKNAAPSLAAKTDSPYQGPVITSLGNGFSIATTARSWSDLTNQTRPDFAWNGRDLLWIQTDDHGQPRFVLDEAYVYQPTNQPRQWVLLREGSRDPANDSESPRFFYSNQNLHAVATLHDHLPPVMDDAGERGDYAIVLNAAQQFGTVYELGWQSEMGVGTAHPAYGRRIYVLRDHDNHWQFLGEGPTEGAARGSENTLNSHVIWSDLAGSNATPQILVQSQDTSFSPVSENDTNPASQVTTTNQYLLKPGSH